MYNIKSDMDVAGRNCMGKMNCNFTHPTPGKSNARVIYVAGWMGEGSFMVLGGVESLKSGKCFKSVKR